MLFTTAVFACVFLPVVLAGFFAAPSERLAAGWLFMASLIFYGYWMPQFTVLLLASIVANFSIGTRIAKAALHRPAASSHEPGAKGWLVLGVVLNLAALAYFKYANFFVSNLSAALGAQ